MFLLCSAAIGIAQERESVLPAGTLLQCTLDEPNFSSQTAERGDPVLCQVRSPAMFGRSVFPRGAYLSARLEDYRDPGRFFGKGWLKLEFTSLALPDRIVPLNAKVISAAPYKVDREGKVRGRGHPRRDAIEWSIPLLWPAKVITLPARGPRPTFKRETRILLRVMEDMSIPQPAALASGARTPGPASSSSGLNASGQTPPRLRFGNFWYGASRVAAAQPEPALSAGLGLSETGSSASRAEPQRGTPRLTLLALKDGRAYVATDYEVRDGKLSYTSPGAAAPQLLPLEDFDLQRTVQLNAERGVPFVLTVRNH